MYVQIMDDIERDIKGGVYPEGAQIPTQKELCEQYKVSRIVASAALSGLSQKGLIVCEKGRGSFVSGKKDIKKKMHACNGTVLFVMPNTISHYASRLANDIMLELEKAGYICLFCFTDNIIEREEKITDLVISSYGSNGSMKFDGLILFSCSKDVYNINAGDLLRFGVPTVLVDRRLPGLPFTCVQTDNRKAIRMAAGLLIEQGHRKIALCMSSQGTITSLSERVDGFIQEMAERGITIDPSLIINQLATPEQQQRLADVFTERRATAFIALNTATYGYVMDVLESCSLCCPDDIAGIVFDKSGTFSEKAVTEPTYIYQNTEMIAKEAVKSLIEKIEGREEEQNQNILIEPKLIMGYSTKNL